MVILIGVDVCDFCGERTLDDEGVCWNCGYEEEDTEYIGDFE